MKIFHGDDQKQSRNFFLIQKQSAKSRGDSVGEMDGQSINYPDFIQTLTSNSLFPESHTYFMEQFFSRRPGKDKEQIRQYLEDHPESNIYIWENKDVSQHLKVFSPSAISKFDLPKYVFRFLDTLDPEILQNALVFVEPEEIFSRLAKQIHNLLLISSDHHSLPAWQYAKLKSLAQKFPPSILLPAYRNLLQIDIRQKSSGSAFDLGSALIIWTTKLQNLTRNV